MRIVIVGGGIAAAYTANALLKKLPRAELLIVSEEPYRPYDRIHLCALVEGSATVEDIALELDSRVKVELAQKITSIDPEAKRIFSEHASYAYDKLIIATGSKPRELFDTSKFDNATTFRSARDSFEIAQKCKGRNVVLVGVGPIGLELLDTLTHMEGPQSITLFSRNKSLYSNDLTPAAVELIARTYETDARVKVLFEDAFVDKTVHDGHITQVRLKSGTIDNPYLIFGIGISPNVDFASDALYCERGIVVD